MQNNFSILNEGPRTHYDSDQDIGNNLNNTSLLCDSRNPTQTQLQVEDSENITQPMTITDNRGKSPGKLGNATLDQYINSAVWA